MIFYVYDANYILGAPIKNRSEAEFLRVYEEVYDELQSKGYKPHFHKMDNETLTEIQEFIRGRKVDVQFTRPKCIARTPQNVVSELGKIILLQVWQACPLISQSPTGAGSSPKRTSP